MPLKNFHFFAEAKKINSFNLAFCTKYLLCTFDHGFKGESLWTRGSKGDGKSPLIYNKRERIKEYV